MNTNTVPPIQQRQRLDGSADGDEDHNNIPPGALSGTAAVIKNIKSMNMVPPTPIRQQQRPAAAADSSPLFKSDDVVTTTGQPDEEVAYPSPTPFDGRDHYDDNNLIKPRRTHDQDPQDRIEEPMPMDYHDFLQDNDSNNNNERQPLRRDPSVITLESDFTKRYLPEDTFTFLIYSHVLSRTFFLATFVFFFQIAIYAVLAYDIIDETSKINPFNFSVYVDAPVRIAEALAIVVAIITQDDVRKAVNLIRDGFDEDLVKAFPGATKVKWILSIALRAIEGLFGLFLTFLLIMRSSTVIDLLLNFLAMEFVSLLDDVVFVLAREGFFGRGHLQKEAMKVSNTFYHVSHFAVVTSN
jgi:hypothetical protein